MRVDKLFDLVVDVGGTNIDIYRWLDEEDCYARIRSEATPRKKKDLYELLLAICKQEEKKEVLIGVPGPINEGGQSECWCFPLGMSLRFSDLEVDGIDIRWSNDTEALAIVMANCGRVKRRPTNCRPDVILTFGTSFGYCSLIYGSNHGPLVYARSSEFAHVQVIPGDTLSKLIEEGTRPFLQSLIRSNYEAVLSAKGINYVKSRYKELLVEIGEQELGEYVMDYKELYWWLTGEILIPLMVMGSPYTGRVMLHGGVVNTMDGRCWKILRERLGYSNLEVDVFASQVEGQITRQT